MDNIELKVNGKQLIFTSKSVTYAGHEFFYSKMSNISHRSGELPEYLFDYEGKRLVIPYDPKDKKITLKIFQQVAAMERKCNAARSPYLAKEEPVAPADEKHYRPWLVTAVIAILILALIAVFVRRDSDPGNNVSVKEGSTGTTTEQGKSEKVKKISLDNDEGTLTYVKSKTTKDYDGKPAVIIYFKYTNKRNKTGTALDTYYPQVFQNGVECETTISADDDIKDIDNASKDVQKGTAIKIAFIFMLQDLRKPITLKVTDMSEKNLFADIYQEQEIALK